MNARSSVKQEQVTDDGAVPVVLEAADWTESMSIQLTLRNFRRCGNAKDFSCTHVAPSERLVHLGAMEPLGPARL